MLSSGRSSSLVKLESGRKNRSVIVRAKQGHDSISHNPSAGNGTAVEEREKQAEKKKTDGSEEENEEQEEGEEEEEKGGEVEEEEDKEEEKGE